MHKWVLSLGWIWNNAGSLCWLQVLSAHSLRGSLGVASKWPNSLPKPQWNEKKKITFGPVKTGESWTSIWFCYLMAASQAPVWGTRSPFGHAGQNSQDFNPLSSRTIPTHLPQRIHCGEQNPFVLQNGLQNPFCRGKRGSSDNCAGHSSTGNPQQTTAAIQRETRSSFDHALAMENEQDVPVPHVQGFAEAERGPSLCLRR